MKVLPLKQLFNVRWRLPKPEQRNEKSTVDQMKEVIELAEGFDRLQALPVWEQIVLHLGKSVTAELMDATKFKFEPARAQVHTIRWDAKREVVDDLLGWIEATQNERARLIEEFSRKGDE